MANDEKEKAWVKIVPAIIAGGATVLAAMLPLYCSSQRRLEQATKAADSETDELRKQVAGLESQVRKCEAEKTVLASQSTAGPPPHPASPQSQLQSSIEGLDFRLEGCARESADLKCWFSVTNNREGRELKIFVDGSWLRDQDNNTHNVARALGTGGESEFNILRVDLPNKSTARFGLQFKGVAGVVTTVRFLKVQALGFDVQFQGEVGVK